MRIYSWNINGLRAGLRHGTFIDFLNSELPDILCLQETKMKKGQADFDLPAYLEYWNSADRPGYSGTAVFTKFQPTNTLNNFPPDIVNAFPWGECAHGNPLTEGRVQTIDYPNFFLVNVYVPNAKPNLARLSVREHVWDPALLRYISQLETVKPVIICGDFNVAPTPLDLARPKENEGHAGYTDAERQGMKNYLAAGFVDTFRYLNPTLQKYTWWSHWGHARENNVGWRIDFFLISPRLLPHLTNAAILDHIPGSDHCPIMIDLEF